jgi:transcriptional antiterminator NusG
MIFVVKVTTNKEEQALEFIAERVKRKSLNVFSVARPHGLRGYILLEADTRETAEEAAFDLPYVKSILAKTLEYSEITSLLEPAVAAVNIEKGDIVEIIAEPFKKEKAKVIRLDKTKEEAVVELLEAMVPIPITVKIDNIKVIRREKAESAESEEKAE